MEVKWKVANRNYCGARDGNHKNMGRKKPAGST